MSEPVVREESKRISPVPISSHIRSGKKSQTAARMTGTSEAGQRLGRRLSPGRFFGSVFFAKKRNSVRYLERYVRRNVAAWNVQIVRSREGQPLPYNGWGTSVAVETVRNVRLREDDILPYDGNTALAVSVEVMRGFRFRDDS